MGFLDKMKESKRTERKQEDSLKERFKKEQEKKVVQPKTRTVRLRYQSSCGCGGGGYSDIIREVPFDSPLRDGDQIHSLITGDREV